MAESAVLRFMFSGPFFMGPGFILSRSVPVSSAELLPGSVGTTFHRQ